MKRFYTSLARLETYLKQNKNTSTNVYRGTLFELQTLYSLESTAKMRLDHVGGRSDGGIDLRGSWLDNIQVIVQCKNVKEGCTPEHLRELIGTVSMIPSRNRKRTISIMATHAQQYYTPDVLAHFKTCPIPLGLASITDITLKSLMFNKAAQSLVKDRVSISTVFDALGSETLQVDISE
ncbi:hypothetical protein RMATCC62417_00928 [Rhizopus microsporus]|jgi:hypothetical protein|uniref:Restriction endonuclease type IV Mrr domain-containing protein n=3 Tax=Rhizopus microsporus TaxID=58291 RepID=A0A2G4T708_RHIZD|nr:uncharacterized protein RHIMIDRAFT_66248 [Rhizopus microsporus ATCC 52813]PHZ16788.1 hypothetical protein RHIMIDRAFT_66248 [Rhizopus microsporus ATCC 52813]CEG63852.1 hypothetical protein RMATCC62417_00928 [Rhizopus microsporus]